MKQLRDYSSLEYVLLALVPYSRPNLDLAFKPSKFFSDLEKTSKKQRNNLQPALSKAIRKGLVERVDGIPVLTAKGRQKIVPLTAKHLKKDVQLMVTFDIPEHLRFKRRQLRTFLKLHDFRQAQKSVWLSPLDFRQEIRMLVDELQIKEFVDIYECSKL